MLNLPRKTLDKIRKTLLRQQEDLERQLKDIENEDPVLAPGVAESTESGTESWKQEIHTRLMTLRGDLLELSKRTKDSLLRLKKGTYGRCDRCGKQIEPERLELVPTANLCIACSKKNS